MTKVLHKFTLFLRLVVILVGGCALSSCGGSDSGSVDQANHNFHITVAPASQANMLQATLGTTASFPIVAAGQTIQLQVKSFNKDASGSLEQGSYESSTLEQQIQQRIDSSGQAARVNLLNCKDQIKPGDSCQFSLSNETKLSQQYSGRIDFSHDDKKDQGVVISGNILSTPITQSSTVSLSVPSSQFKVSLQAFVKSGSLSGAAYHYTDPYMNDSNDNVEWMSIGKKQFKNLDTFQFVLPGKKDAGMSLENIFSNLNLSISDQANKYQCARVFSGDSYNDVSLGAFNKIPASYVSSGNPASPLHLTIIPFHAASADCRSANPEGNDFDAADVLALWISTKDELNSVSSTAQACTFDSNKTYTLDDLSNGKLDGCNTVFNMPYWALVPEGCADRGNCKALEYRGTLYDSLTNPKEKNSALQINIPLNTTLKFPVTSEVVRLPIKNLEQPTLYNCAMAVATYNAQLKSNFHVYQDPKNLLQACPLDVASDNYMKHRSYTYSADTSRSISVTGFGRIDGSDIISMYGDKTGMEAGPLNPGMDFGRPCADINLGSITACDSNPQDDIAAGYIRYAEWRINTSLLGLSSGYRSSNAKDPASDPAIRVTGVTVAETPIRNRGTVQLNLPQFGPYSSDFDALPKVPINNQDKSFTETINSNNTPVSMYDFKQVASWLSASDGPDIGSDNSVMDYSYLHAADDTLKIAAKNQTYSNATLLQGGVGGINIGMYGVSRDGVSGSSISNVSVPRITHGGRGDDSETWNPYSSTTGLITTRTCARVYQNGSSPQTGTTLGGVLVSGVRVFALGADAISSPASNPNSIVNLIAMGVAADSIYCSTKFDSGQPDANYKFGPSDSPFVLNMINSDIMPSKEYSNSGGGLAGFFYNMGLAQPVVWGTPAINIKSIKIGSKIPAVASYNTQGSGIGAGQNMNIQYPND